MLKTYKHFVFIAAGGKGKRLWKIYPVLKSYDLPKSLGLVFDGRPLIAYQLRALAKLPAYQIIICFDESRSLEYFTSLVRDCVVPKLDYVYLLDHYGPKNNIRDILLGSGVNDYLGDGFETIVLSSGDLLYDANLLNNMHDKYKKTGCNIVLANNRFPYLLTKKAFEIYTDSNRRTSTSDFVRRAKFEGERFRTVISKKYFDIDTSEDYVEIKKHLE